MLPIPLSEQYSLLESEAFQQAVKKYLGGDPSRLHELFSITQREYLAWVLPRPISESDWYHTCPSVQDGLYFLNPSPNLWTIHEQDRGRTLWTKHFASYIEARKFWEVDIGFGRNLRN